MTKQKYYGDDSYEYLSGKLEGLVLAKVYINSLGSDGNWITRESFIEKIDETTKEVYEKIKEIRANPKSKGMK